MGTSGYLDDWGCLNIDGTVVVKCFDDLIPANGYVKIPEGATKIEERAFNGCESLTSVTIPEGVTSIKNRAFSGCKSLRSVVIPRSVTEIGDDAFRDCESLRSVTIPEGVTSIGYQAFGWCSSLTSVAIPRSVTEIGNWAFAGCENLTIYYGGSVWSDVRCGNGAFKPDLPVYCDWHGPAPDDDEQRVGAFAGRTDLTSAVIPRGTSYIGSNEYKGCVNLMSVVIPRSVRRIGNKAFTDCKCLTVYYEGSKAEFYDISWQDYPFHCTMRISYDWSLQKPPPP